jgi:hypothetical protein
MSHEGFGGTSSSQSKKPEGAALAAVPVIENAQNVIEKTTMGLHEMQVRLMKAVYLAAHPGANMDESATRNAAALYWRDKGYAEGFATRDSASSEDVEVAPDSTEEIAGASNLSTEERLALRETIRHLRGIGGAEETVH